MDKPSGWADKWKAALAQDGKEFTVYSFGSSGHAIHKDGSVWLMRDGEWRRATRREALRLRANVRAIFGEEISDIAGIEPE